ncbi:alpha-2-macroglobulin-like protein 1 [Astyanax mexicanus]|uniref:alpha-2-macroglobulin-like protein 1 n=1 Tax=Astyanax mexicanus TaxID=7994 RepID=UPI0020CB5E1A|nr:alpha-2-macroglobulin-like protein 1 [Astyanax mexicanus]
MVSVTSQAVGGTTETLCAHVYPERKLVSVVVRLHTDETSWDLLKRRVAVQEFYECVSFKVPDVNIETEASVDIQVSGKGIFLNKTTKILITPPVRLTIIQTDKPIYKPGQTVKIRIASLTSSFQTYDQQFPTIEIQDPNSNRIGQWLNQSTFSGILDLSYPLNSEAQHGFYIITVWNERNEQITQDFEINEYVLPTFEVIVQLPPVITILDTEATLKVCGNYTYGKPVNGSVIAVVCRKHYVWWWFGYDSKSNLDICKTYSMTTDKAGCGSAVLNLEEYALTATEYEDVINVEAQLEEAGTGVVLNGTGSTTITINMLNINFEETPASFRLGMPFNGKIKVTGPNSVPAKDEHVYLIVRYDDDKNVTWTLVTDANGTAPFSLNTALWGSKSVSLEAKSDKSVEQYGYMSVRKPTYFSAYLWVQPFYSESNCFLELQPSPRPFYCNKPAVVNARYIINSNVLTQCQKSMTFFYMVMSKGSMVQYGQLSAPMRKETVNKGTLTIQLEHVKNMAPFAQVVVYTILPNGEAMADSRDFAVDLCLTNQVSLIFPSPTELPGGQTSLILKAQPGSLCSVKAIDRSLLLLKPEKELDIDYVFNLLPVQKLSGYPYNIYDEEPNPCISRPPIRPPIIGIVPQPLPEVRPAPVAAALSPRLRTSFFPYYSSSTDVFSVFKNIGIKILTNAEVRKPVDCSGPIFLARPAVAAMDAPMEFGAPMLLARETAVAAPDVAVQSDQTIRTYFPETWIWDLVPVGKSGIMGVKKTVPDTITTWSARAFCMSAVGFGIAPKAELTTFQPFFVSLTLPYSIIRGEVLPLKATVFNYLSGCIMVKVTLAHSEQFTAQQCERCIYTRCLCADESWTFKWTVQASALGTLSFNVSAEALQTNVLCGSRSVTVPEKGRMDTVVQTLLVKAEGTKQTNTYNELLCMTGAAVEKTISLQLPTEYVQGSDTASVSVLGDLMGRALKNLQSLLAMPYGCGEQNMLLFAPNIFILLYLESSGQLTPEIRSKATTFLVSGYQRELTYKHDDGSYSAFGMSDPSGNTWLTAFVMKSFSSAMKYIFVDQQYVDKAKDWLGLQQQENGCFASVGQLFHSDMKGGVSDELTLTAYITAAMLELGTPVSDPVVEKSLTCLKSNFTQLNSTYSIALLSYAFTLAEDHQMRLESLNILDEQAIVTAGGRHWSRLNDGKTLDSLEVEMTSYVLLAILSGPQLQGFDLGYCASIVRWLAQQQNAFGGFASTQDTVVALQALAKYSAVTYSPAGTTVVTVTGPSGNTLTTFTVNQSNRLLVQESSLQQTSGNYSIRAEGNGCVLVQFTLNYNIPPPANYLSFNIFANISAKCSDLIPSAELSVTVRYNGNRVETNMVIIEVRLLSGFRLDEKSLFLSNDTSALNEGAIKRVDQKQDTVFIYLDGLTRGEFKTYHLVILQQTVVQKLKPAVIKVYDYYQTSDVAVADYTWPCN